MERQKIVIPAPPGSGGSSASPHSRPSRPKRASAPGPTRQSRGGRAPAPATPDPGRKSKRAHPWRRRIWISSLLALLVVTVYSAIVAVRTQAALKRTGPEVTAQLSRGPGPTTILMTGSDTRSGENDFVPGRAGAGLSDVIMLIQLRGSEARILSIPRDTRVKLPGYGEQKVNAALALGGPSLAVTAVRDLTGIAIHRFAEIDFEGFVRITDSVGGVEICSDFRQRDTMSGLDLPAGCSNVKGEQALAYVRSRHNEQLQNGKWVSDPEGDLGRIKRQQAFMGALIGKAMSPSVAFGNSWSLGPSIASAFTVDPGFSVVDEFKFAWALSGGSESMELHSLPVTPNTIRGIAYLDMKQPEAAEMLRRFKEG